MGKATAKMLPDGRVSIEASNYAWRFKRVRPYMGKLWSGQYYAKQPSYVIYNENDIKYIWRKSGQLEPIKQENTNG